MKFDHPRLPSFVLEATDFVFKRVRFKVTFTVACTREEQSNIYVIVAINTRQMYYS